MTSFVVGLMCQREMGVASRLSCSIIGTPRYSATAAHGRALLASKYVTTLRFSRLKLDPPSLIAKASCGATQLPKEAVAAGSWSEGLLNIPHPIIVRANEHEE
jgi:hypothetical protein